MYKNVLEGIENIAVWPVVSFVIFFLFFICLLWHVLTIKKDFIQRMKNLPLDDAKKPDRESTLSAKMLLLPVLLFLYPVGAWAQDTTPSPNPAMLPIYLIIVLVGIILLIVLIVTIVAFQVFHLIERRSEEARAKKLGVPYVPPLSTWEKFWVKINGLAPMEQEKDIELAHSYDGIKELDNHLPPWWKGLFYGCIVFAVVYMFIYHFSGILPLSTGEYENELAIANEEARILRASQPPEVIDLNTLTYSHDEAFITKGQQLFVRNNCASCHRIDGGGNSVGPNLTDAYWLHGGSIKDVFTTINQGVIEKAMPAWGKVMSQKDVRDLAFYVLSLQGSAPKDAKKPQGELYKQEEMKPAADSTKLSMKKQ